MLEIPRRLSVTAVELGGGHHPGVLIVLSSRCSRRPAGVGPLIAAIQAIAGERIADRVVYLNKPKRA